jgi:glycosyltransferase involved in cell wall biosynthesis
VPLAYEEPVKTVGFVRTYRTEFSVERPLRVLFLGQVNLRKGVLPLFEAIRLLRDEPVEFWFVGPPQVPIPPDLERTPTVRWFGAVPRRETWRFYRDADVFILPTFSDGFGLTQLEAQAWKLPVIASRHCGQVAVDGESGLVLRSVTAAEICCAIRKVIAEPQLLQRFADHALAPAQFGLQSFHRALMRAVMT